MTMVSLPSVLAWEPRLPALGGQTNTIGSQTTFTMNAAGDKIGLVFRAQSSSVPDQLSFVIASFTSTGTLDATLETVDATTGMPSGTPVTNSATGSLSITSTGNKTITGMSGTATVARGDLLAIVLTATTGFAGTFTVQTLHGSAAGGGFPYLATKDTAGAWTKTNSGIIPILFGLADASGTYLNILGYTGACTAALLNITDASNPDEYGNRFIFPTPVVLCGARVYSNNGSASADGHSFAVSLYTTHTGTPNQLATKAIDGDALMASLEKDIWFDTDVTIPANTVVALTYKATAGTGNGPVELTYASNAQVGSLLGSVDFYKTARDGGTGQPANPGNAFTDTNTRVITIFPLIRQIDDGNGVGRAQFCLGI